ncbi:MAG: potassium transporter TrkG, partial [Bacteroidota bacterium]
MASDPDTNAFWARLGGRERARRWLRTGGEVLGVAGGALAIAAVGFEHSLATTSLLGGAMSVVAGALALVWTVWLLAAPERRQAARAHRGTTVGVPVLVGALAAALLNAGVGYGLLAAALVGALVSVASRQAYRLTQLRIPPEVVVLGLFAALIAVGAGALLLPRATTAPGSLAPLDALFMATSAVSVTGLGVVPTAETFTALGEGILLVLIQVGALGIVSTVVAGTVFFGGGYGIGTRALLQDIWDTKTVGEVRQLVRQIVLLALAIEAVGAVGIYLTADLTAVAGQADATRLDRVYFAVFHAISAFCNAGFSTLSSSFADPALATDVAFNLVAMALIVLGGLGFIVVRETAMRLRTQKPGVQKYGVQVRLVWAMTG